MARTTLDIKSIDLLRDIPDIVPVNWDRSHPWSIKVIRRAPDTCKNYLSPNRREFYKIMYVKKGTGVFTLGMKNFYIDEPTILFLHPNEIISWRKLSTDAEGYVCFFKKQLADEHPNLKQVIEKYRLFSDTSKSVIRLSAADVAELDNLFGQMAAVEAGEVGGVAAGEAGAAGGAVIGGAVAGGTLAEDAMQAFLQLVMIASLRTARYAEPDTISDEFRHIHEFFQLLEKETAHVNYSTPIQIKTAKEFAEKLFVHPNHLNALLKKHTGQNLSTHIKNRLLEESKVLLLQTDWTLQDIGYAIGYADQPNFSQFFKKSTGMTPAEFRKSHGV